MPQATPMKFSDLEKSRTGEVWVLNASPAKDRTLIVLSIPKAGGGQENIRVPVTWMPVELTAQAPKSQLLDSSDFRKAVRSGYLTLISSEDAQKMRERPGAQQELQRLAIEDRSISSDSARMTSGQNSPDPVASDLSPRVQQFIVNMEEATEPMPVLNTLRSMGQLEEAEFRAISKTAEAKRGFGEIVTYCEEQISQDA